MAVFEININLRLPPEISAALAALAGKVDHMTQEVDDLVEQVAKVGPAINAFEARITAILAASGMSAEDKAKIVQATADLKGDLADADDGVDEAATPPTP